MTWNANLYLETHPLYQTAQHFQLITLNFDWLHFFGHENKYMLLELIRSLVSKIMKLMFISFLYSFKFLSSKTLNLFHENKLFWWELFIIDNWLTTNYSNNFDSGIYNYFTLNQKFNRSSYYDRELVMKLRKRADGSGCVLLLTPAKSLLTWYLLSLLRCIITIKKYITWNVHIFLE